VDVVCHTEGTADSAGEAFADGALDVVGEGGDEVGGEAAEEGVGEGEDGLRGGEVEEPVFGREGVGDGLGREAGEPLLGREPPQSDVGREALKTELGGDGGEELEEGLACGGRDEGGVFHDGLPGGVFGELGAASGSGVRPSVMANESA
jgi:hypothetical protein